MTGFTSAEMPMRSSTIAYSERKIFLGPSNMLFWHHSTNRDRIRSDFDAPVFDATRIFRQAVRRRTCSDAAVFVVDAAVARAHEEARVGHPSHGAAEVRTV